MAMKERMGSFNKVKDVEDLKSRYQAMLSQSEKFGKITAQILSVTDEKILFDQISKAIVEISDFNRCLISYFVDYPPYREIIGVAGVDENLVDTIRKIEMPRQKYLEPLEKAVKLGPQTFYVPHTIKDIFEEGEVLFGQGEYNKKKDFEWHPEDNLFVLLIDENGDVIGAISVDESKSGKAPDNESIKPLEIFANQISQIIKNMILQNKLIESEQKYRMLVESAKDLIFRFDYKTGNLIYINPSVKNLLKYDQEDLYNTQNIIKFLIHPEDLRKFKRNIPKKTAGSSKEIDVRLRNKKGKYIDCSTVIYSIGIGGGNEIFGCIARDLTEHKKMEKLERKIEQERVLLQMAGAAAHELNQPLTALMGRIDLASLKKDDSEQLNENLTCIRKAAMTIIETVQKIQSIDRYETKEYLGETRIIDIDKSSSRHDLH